MKGYQQVLDLKRAHRLSTQAVDNFVGKLCKRALNACQTGTYVILLQKAARIVIPYKSMT